MNKPILYLLLLSMLTACDKSINQKESQATTSSTVYTKKLVEQGNVSFEIDSTTSFSPFTMQYIDEGNQEYLLTSNQNLTSIDVLSFHTKKLHRRIMLNDSKSKIANNIHGFWATSLDSIYAYSKFNLNIILISSEKGLVKSKEIIYVSPPATRERFYNHASMTACPSLIANHKIYFSEMPFGDIGSLIGTGYAMELVYDIKKDSSYLSGITWPKMYEETQWDNFFFHLKTVDEDNRIIYSWEANHSLVVKSQDTITHVLAKSDAFEDEMQYDFSNIDEEGKDINFIEANRYMMVLHDKYRKVYYRFAIHGMHLLRSDGSHNTVYDLPFSVIILDEDFNKIGESYFEGGKYMPKDSFVGKEGLYISSHNMNNMENMNEDSMTFTLLKLVDNEKI